MPTIPGVIGTDDGQPIYEPNARWCWWSIKEIYTGTLGTNKYIPKVGDYVMDPDVYTTYKVDALDPNTFIPTLKLIKPSQMDNEMTENDVLFGVGPGTQADTYRIYLNQNTLPFTFTVDSRLHVGGSMCSYCKIFKGSVVNGSGEVISKWYDSNGQFVSENIPLELVALDSHTNHAIKTVKPAKSTTPLLDGEIVTAVFYSDTGIVVSKRQLLVENTNFIRVLNASQKQVTGISLECPFMSPTLDHQIDFPLNVPMNALNMIGVVHYNDGTTMKHPVDGTKFSMYGIDSVVSSIIGQQISLVLRYALSSNEASNTGTGVEGNYITEPYKLVVVNPNNSYTVKLFGYPYWVSDVAGFQMRWWLLNLDRNIWFDVTNLVSFNPNTGPYDPKAYGILQRKSVSINLRNVSGAFKNFVHTQVVDIVLQGPPDQIDNCWEVSHESNVSRPMYGTGLFAKKVASNLVNLSSGITEYSEWKQRVYTATYPLLNPANETTPMNPTDFYVEYNGVSTRYPITDWNHNLNISGTVDFNKTLSIRFVKLTGGAELQLSIAAMIINP